MNAPSEIATLDTSMVECPQISESEKESLLAVMKLARSDSTRRSYTDNLSKFEKSHVIPAHPVTVASWLIAQMNARIESEGIPYKRTTILAWLVAIRLAHLARGFADPTDSPIVQDTLEGLCRKYEGISEQKRAKTLTKTEILNMVKKCKSGNPSKDLRDKVLIILGYTGGFRISELLNLQCKNIVPSQFEGFSGYEVLMGKTKTDQRGDKGFKKLIPYEGKTVSPALVLKEWLDLIGNSGYVLRSVEKNGRVNDDSITYNTALTSLRTMAQQAKVKDWHLVTTHSLRRSFVTFSYKKGYTNHQIAKQTNQAVSTVNRYIEDFDVYEKNPALKLWL